MTKIIKLFSNLHSWKTLLDCITVTKILKCSGQTDVENEEIDLKPVVSWQNILISRQIAPDVEKK